MDNSFMHRRTWLSRTGSGLGWCALAGMTTSAARGEQAADSDRSPQTLGPDTSPGPLVAKPPHFPPRAKRVIMLFMQGGPSQLDMFDPKPALASTQNSGRGARLMASPWKFRNCGQSGLPISELLPKLGEHADSLCVLNGMHTDNPAHPQATLMMHTGAINFVRPSMGSWIVYGLGTENQDLPGFVTINPDGNPGGGQNFGSAFLPAAYQGTRVSAGDAPIANIRNRRRTSAEQRRHLDLLQSMNRDGLASSLDPSDLEGIVESYELAFRMQTAVPELMFALVHWAQ